MPAERSNTPSSRRRLGRLAQHVSRHPSSAAAPPSSHSEAAAGGEEQLSAELKADFARDGYVILRNAVSKRLTQAARRAVNIENGRKGGWRGAYAKLARHAAMMELITQSRLGSLLETEMGAFVPPTVCQPTIIHPVERLSSKPSPLSGVPIDQTPFFGVDLHLDGLWTAKRNPSPAEIGEPNSGGSPRDRRKYFGDDDHRVADGAGTLLWMDPERRLSVGSFTAFVGVALNDQLEEGRGQLNLLGGGAHTAMQGFYRKQRAAGGVIGPEGPGWPRFQLVGEAHDSVGITFMPPEVRQEFALRDGAAFAAGMPWPKPTPIMLAEGDAVIALQNVPHSSSQNLGPDPRMNIYFRLRVDRGPRAALLSEEDREKFAAGQGVSDHPDRGYEGEMLRYADPGYDPFAASIDALCDHWAEWRGMR
jgi:hypothetical protein